MFVHIYRKDAYAACSTSQLEILQAAQFDDHHSTVWRISWNITGTILASSGDDGCLRLWKGTEKYFYLHFLILFYYNIYSMCCVANYLQNWKCIAVLKGDGSGVNTEEGVDREKSVSATARYFKLGTISNPNQVPWH